MIFNYNNILTDLVFRAGTRLENAFLEQSFVCSGDKLIDLKRKRKMPTKSSHRSRTGMTRIVHRCIPSFLIMLFGLTTVAVLISVSVAAAADFHPDGYDKNCNLCQFTNAPLITTSLQLIVPPGYCNIWDMPLFPVTFYQELILCMGGSRAPPSLTPFSV